MQVNIFIISVAVVFACLDLTGAHDFVINCDLLNNYILPTVGLGGGSSSPSFDLRGAPVLDQWDIREQFEGFGIAQALLKALEQIAKAHNKGTVPTHFVDFKNGNHDAFLGKNLKILFVGGFGGNGLGGWIAATILSALGIECELYVIPDENTGFPPTVAGRHAHTIINHTFNHTSTAGNTTFRGIKIINRDPRTRRTVPEMLNKSVNNLNPATKDFNVAMAALKTEAPELDGVKENKELLEKVIVNNYDMVVDGITGAMSQTAEFKYGAIFALNLLNIAQRVSTNNAQRKPDNILVSLDIPSFWDANMGPQMPEAYTKFGIQPLLPGIIVHVGAMKPFVNSTNPDFKNRLAKMLHYVVIPSPLGTALDVTAHGNFFSGAKPLLGLPGAFATKANAGKQVAAFTNKQLFTPIKIVAQIDDSALRAVRAAKRAVKTVFGISTFINFNNSNLGINYFAGYADQLV